MTHRAPFPAYWVQPGQLMAGQYPGSSDRAEAVRKLAWLLGRGLRTFVDLTEADEVTGWTGRVAPYRELLAEEADRLGVRADHRRFPIRDLDVPSPAGMEAILACLDESLAEGRPAYVHCLGGMGRTGTVVACYLLRRANRSPARPEDPEDPAEAALCRVVELRTAQGVPYPEDSPQTSVQFRFVRRWARGVPDA